MPDLATVIARRVRSGAGRRRSADARPGACSRSCSRDWNASHFESPLLQRLVKSLETEGLPASAQIRRLARLLHLLDYQTEPVLHAVRGALALDDPARAPDRRLAGGSGRRIGHWLDGRSASLRPCVRLGVVRRGKPGRPVPRDRRGPRMLRGRGDWAIRCSRRRSASATTSRWAMRRGS